MRERRWESRDMLGGGSEFDNDIDGNKNNYSIKDNNGNDRDKIVFSDS